MRKIFKKKNYLLSFKGRTSLFLAVFLIMSTALNVLAEQRSVQVTEAPATQTEAENADLETDVMTELSTVLEFEQLNPVYTEEVEYGTLREDLNLPESLRGVLELEGDITVVGLLTGQDNDDSDTGESELPTMTFEQKAPPENEDGDYDYYWYSYVAPEEEQELREAGELVIYTIYYQGGSESYRVYGTLNGKNEGFYACDEDGNIYGIVLDIPVSWSAETYEGQEEGTYIFTAAVADYTYEGDLPTAEITVKEQKAAEESEHTDDYEGDECSCGTVTEEHAQSCPLYTIPCTCGQSENGHIEGCPLWEPTCTCPEDAEGHTDTDCPYYVGTAACECGIAADSKPWEHQEDCPLFGKPVCTCEGGVHNPINKDCLLYVGISTRSLNGGGANDVAGDALMNANAPTSGNSGYTSTYTGGEIPGSWVDYVNTLWRNKGYNQFEWRSASNTGAYNNWVWGGTIASQTTGTTTTNALRIPAADSSRVWTVYSGEQLRYALLNFTTGDTIALGANINLNGSAYNWGGIYLNAAGTSVLTINGNGNTIFNLGSLADPAADAELQYTIGAVSFIYSYRTLTVKNLTFSNAKLVGGKYAERTAIFGKAVNGAYQRSFTEVEVKNSLIFGTVNASILGSVGNLGASNSDPGTLSISKCFTTSNYMYGTDHVSGFVCEASDMTASYCASYDNLICGTGGHSAGFIPCSSAGTITISNCFTANEMYGSAYVCAFVGLVSGTTDNCFASGKLEGYAGLSGFMLNTGFYGNQTITNCYSTVLVGLRSRASSITASEQMQGGFAYIYNMDGSIEGSQFKMTNCYAAGEVGNYDVDLDNPKSVGGFMASTTSYSSMSASYTNCYYDKQTTAMREWTAGNVKDVNGITGVLTSTTDKAGTGLASGTWGTVGFKGFTSNSQWVYTSEHYPQISVFANATSGTWGSSTRANAVKVWSLASVATVFLDTWDTGYDWDSTGVRTSSEVTYDRTQSSTGKSDHVGYEYTYDTVREIVSDFTVTSSASWSKMIAGGAPASLISDSTATTVTNTVEITGAQGTVENPGMEWYSISETTGSQTGYRPLRLTAFMGVDAGDDASVTSGQKYNHRSGVALAMINTITNNLVVGLDNTKIWSTAKASSYPDTTKYYKVATPATDFSASKDAWLYTDIRRVQKDGSNNYVLDAAGDYITDYAVKVTGSGTGSNSTIDEQKWNGELSLYSNTSVEQKYIITYYWMLADGRYRTDSKIITIAPGEYDLTVDVYNQGDGSANSTALYTGAAPDSAGNTNYTISSATRSHDEALNNAYATNVTAAWEKDSRGTKVVRMQVTMTDNNGTVVGTKEISGSDLVEGTQITVPITYYYVTLVNDATEGDREITAVETVNVTYTVKKDTGGAYYLQFNKLANVPATEIASAAQYGDSTGIPSTAKAYINDLSYNVQIKLWVDESDSFSIKKVLQSPAEEEEKFVFRVDYCGKNTAIGAVEQTMYAVLTIPAGKSQATATFENMSMGWYTVTEMDSNWRFELVGSLLASDNPGAKATDAKKGMVTRWLDTGNNASFCFLFTNCRLDIPWVNNKASITNKMPALSD